VSSDAEFAGVAVSSLRTGFLTGLRLADTAAKAVVVIATLLSFGAGAGDAFAGLRSRAVRVLETSAEGAAPLIKTDLSIPTGEVGLARLRAGAVVADEIGQAVYVLGAYRSAQTVRRVSTTGLVSRTVGVDKADATFASLAQFAISAINIGGTGGLALASFTSSVADAVKVSGAGRSIITFPTADVAGLSTGAVAVHQTVRRGHANGVETDIAGFAILVGITGVGTGTADTQTFAEAVLICIAGVGLDAA
jgi:hypothetical protein